MKMTMSITTKLHLILILTIVGVAVYMFLLYKEVRLFEHDVRLLRAQVNSLEMAVHAGAAPQTPPKPQGTPESLPTRPKQQQQEEGLMDNAADLDIDEDSVTSHEIQDLISNIQQVDDADDDIPAAAVTTTQVTHETHEFTDATLLSSPASETPVPQTSVVDEIGVDDDAVKDSIMRAQMASEKPEVKEMTRDELSALSFNEVRALLKSHGVQMQGKKNELIEAYLKLTESS